MTEQQSPSRPELPKKVALEMRRRKIILGLQAGFSMIGLGLSGVAWLTGSPELAQTVLVGVGTTGVLGFFLQLSRYQEAEDKHAINTQPIVKSDKTPPSLKSPRPKVYPKPRDLLGKMRSKKHNEHEGHDDRFGG